MAPTQTNPRFAAPPRDIAIVMLSAIGDAVHVLPLVNALKRAYPDTRITWVVQPGAYQLVRDHPAVDSFILFHRRRGLSAVRSFFEIRHMLRRRRFDLVIGLQVYFKAGVITAMTRSRVKLGFDVARARDLNWVFTTHRIPARPAQHVQDQYFEFLDYLGVEHRPIEWRIELTDAEREAQREFFDQLDAPACAVVAGTSKPQKNWAPERYAQVLDALEAEHGLRPVLVGGPSQLERKIADRILDTTRARTVDMLGDDLRRLVWILDGSALVISPDTGPLHIARALDRPVIGLYGYTNPKRNSPYRKYSDLLVDGYARFPGEDYPCNMEYRPDGMGRVTAQAVLEKVRLAEARYMPSRGSAPSGSVAGDEASAP